jgi:hypothetical protein
MIATLNRPSSLIHEIQLEKVDNWTLFKFSESLQLRMECLLEKKKADRLSRTYGDQGLLRPESCQ